LSAHAFVVGAMTELADQQKVAEFDVASMPSGRGAMPPQLKPQVLAYEPIPQWATGTGVMAWMAD
jgi:hypothetical protein